MTDRAVLLSIKPKYCELIASGKKTVEVRKTRPKLETPFKVYIYCTNTRPYLVWGDVFRGNWETEFTHLSGYNRKDDEKIWDVFNGKVIGEFVCDKIITVDCDSFAPFDCNTKEYINKESCLSRDDFVKYTGCKMAYGWHISELVIYDEQKELSKFYKVDFEEIYSQWEDLHCIGTKGIDSVSFPPEPKEDEYRIKRPPQSWCYVQEAK